MARDEEVEGENSQRGGNGGTNGVRVRLRPDPFLVVCRVFGVITAFAALLCIATNVLSAIRAFTTQSDIFDGIFRCYAVVITIFVVVAETEWGFIMQFLKVLEFWVARGMLQIFVAVMTKAYFDDSDNKEWLTLLQDIASYMLLGCGVLYIIAGILCIGTLKRARQKKEVSRGQAVKDLQELERRREELEALLLVNEEERV